MCNGWLRYDGPMRRMPSVPRPGLARLRVDAGLSQRQLADLLGLTSPRAVKAWEAGDYAPGVAQVPALARALGVSVEAVVAAVVSEDADDERTRAQAARPSPDELLESVELQARALEGLARRLRGDVAALRRSPPRADARDVPEAAPVKPTATHGKR